jgi:hypothetical protein
VYLWQSEVLRSDQNLPYEYVLSRDLRLSLLDLLWVTLTLCLIFQNLASLRRTAFANQNKLTSFLNASTSTIPSQIPELKWDNHWFPHYS